jgi:gliding motility-associated-like protein
VFQDILFRHKKCLAAPTILYNLVTVRIKGYLFVFVLLMPATFFGQYIISGSANATGNNCYQLTPNSTYQVGSVWNAGLINLNNPFDFTFNVFLGCDDAGADGICFGLQPIGTSVGVNGNGMGLGGVTPSLGVYIDTYQNTGDSDPLFDHISLNANGDVNHASGSNLAGPVQANATNANIEDCTNHQLRVEWNPVTQTYNVWFDGSLRFTYTGNIVANIFGGNPNVYWGFTGATGLLTNQQSFCIVTATNFSSTTNCYTTPVQFTDLSVSGTPITNWTWNFGDGSTIISGSGSSFQNPNHTYTTPGTYSVTLTITNTGGAVSSITNAVIVSAPPPITAVGGTTICAGQSVQLSGTNGPNVPVPLSFTCNTSNSNVTIPDNGVGTGWTGNTFGLFATSNINVSGLSAGWTFNSVTLNINHPYDGDLTVYLFNPCGQSIQLINSNGGAGDNFNNTTFNSSATNAIGSGGPPFNGTFIPQGGAAAFNTWIANSQACAGANGNWYLRLGDHAGGDIGTLVNWSLNLNNSVPPSFAWAPTQNMSNANTLTPTVSPTVTTTYTLSSNNSQGCVSTAITTVTVISNLSISVNSPTVCAGSMAQLVASGASAYTWQTGITSTGINTAQVSPAATTTYTVSGNTNNCNATTTFTVHIAPNLSLTVNSPSICNGQTATLNANGASNYTWSAGATPTISGSATASPTTSTTYTINGNTGACTGSITAIVTVNQLPIIAVSNISVCNGQSGTLTANGGNSYLWSNGATTASITVSPISSTNYTVVGTSLQGCSSSAIANATVSPSLGISVNAPSICFGQTANLTASGASTYTWQASITSTGTNTASVSPTATTSYTVSGTSGLCSGSTTFTVEVAPAINVSVNSISICNGDVAQITATGANSYAWSAGLTSTGINTANVSPSNTTTYSVTGSISNCSANASFTVTVNNIPNMSISSITICDGQTGNLAASGAANYVWSTGATTSSISVNPINTTTYSVIGTNAGCNNTATATVTVNPAVVVSINTSSICFGETSIITANGANNYIWQTGITPTGINTASASPNTTTSYTVIGTSGICSGAATFTVDVAPQILLNVNNATICNGGTALLTASGASSYVWSTGANATGVNAANASPNTSTNYTVIGTVGTCSASAIANVLVNTLPSISVTSTSVCSGQSATLTATGAVDFIWSNGSTQNSITVNPSSTTLFTVQGNSFGCLSNIATASVTVTTGVTITASSATICAGEIAMVYATGASSYSWNSTNTNISGDTIYVSPQTSINYTVTGSSSGCSGTSISVITVNPTPNASFTAPLHTNVLSPEVSFQNVSSASTNWLWNFGDTLSFVNNNSTLQQPSHQYQQPGEYCITLIASNAFCADTTVDCIFIDPQFAIYIPNAFTPNGNSVNDGFIPKGMYIKDFKMNIYDRWGNMIYETNELSKPWNGSIKGGSEPAMDDVYVYVIKVTDIQEANHKYIGSVTLIK